jgi:hypothetical protein
MAVTLAPRINTVAMRIALASFCNAHASLSAFLDCETELPTGRTIHTPNPAGGSPLRSLVWKKNITIVEGMRAASWVEQYAPNLVWDEIQEDAVELPSQRHRQRLTYTVRGLLTCLGASPEDADDRVLQVLDVLRDIFLGSGALIGTQPNDHHIQDVMWRGSLWDPVPRSSPLFSSRIINLQIQMGER